MTTPAPYSPRERTALVFLGTGTAGAYHAGVLQALLEAGVRVDLVAGRGMGAVSAMYAAVDAGARLWEATGIWRAAQGPRGLYRWRPIWRFVGGCALAAVGMLSLPLLGLAALAGAYPVLLTLGLLWPTGGAAAIERWRDLAAWIGGPTVLGSLVPRLATSALLVGALTALGSYIVTRWRVGKPREGRGALWWRTLGAPLDADGALRWALEGFWQFMRGAAAIAQPPPLELSRRYTELASDSLGQPGYREVLFVAHDLETRRDVVFALLGEPWRKRFLGRAAAGEGGDLVDLAGAGRVHLADAVAAALALPVLCEPHLVTFAPESYWRGETHRLTDRPSAVSRLLREVRDAGATQVIVVSAVSATRGPHALTRPGAGPRERLGETTAAIEAAALEDAAVAHQGDFRALCHIRLDHNPVGPLAFAGASDQRSERAVALGELVDRGYEDAYRQFLEPVVGASGEQIHGATVVGPTPSPADLSLKLVKEPD